MTIVDFAPGGFRFIPAGFQFSSGVTALPGFAVHRVRFRSPVPLSQGFSTIEQFIRAAGRPPVSFCACELRSPAPFTDAGFRAFNESYVEPLRKWGLFDGNTNPVARSNVCAAIGPVAEPSFHAFAFTVPVPDAPPTFVISGSAEAREGKGGYQERTIRHGETDPDAMREKARFVVSEIERRLEVFDCGWADTTATQVYTVHDIHPFFADEIVRRGAAHAGLTWHLHRPPVLGLEFEMDCRSIALELVI
jgi:hypothetical protein